MEEAGDILRGLSVLSNLEREENMNEGLVKLSYKIILKFRICKIVDGSTFINLLDP